MATVAKAGKVSRSGLIHLQLDETFYVESVDADGLMFGQVVITPEKHALTWVLATGRMGLHSEVKLADRRLLSYLRVGALDGSLGGFSNDIQLPGTPPWIHAGGSIALACQTEAESVPIGVVVCAMPLAASLEAGSKDLPSAVQPLGKCNLLAEILVQVLFATAALPEAAMPDGKALPAPTESVILAPPIPPPASHPSRAEADVSSVLSARVSGSEGPG